MNMLLKKMPFLLVVTLCMLVLAACNTDEESKDDATKTDEKTASTETVTNYADDVSENPIVTITMADDAKIVLELEPKTAPNTVANFISLVQSKFYDGLIFHRVIPSFMIQGGDPDGNGSGGPGYSIDGEFSINGFENNLAHERGVISMARTADPNSAGSQFFIMTEAASHLDGQYAAFGKVIEGIETVDAIVNVERDGSDKPIEDQTIKTIEVDTKGFTYPDPIINK